MSGWDARSYDRISGPHAELGLEALDRLRLRGDERVMDAGCGSGRVTERLIERLPRGSVVALDGSATMLEQARQRLASHGDRVSYVRADLASPPLPVDPPIDAVLSTAAFHWVVDHETLFRGLAGVMRPGAQLSFKCGGRGNFGEIIEVVRDAGIETAHLFTFAGPDETIERLTAAGFRDADAWLSTESIHFETIDELAEYVITPYLRPATELPEADLRRLADAIAERLGEQVIHYVRLNATARMA